MKVKALFLGMAMLAVAPAAAQTADAGGWVRADSDKGAFSIDIPCKFEELATTSGPGSTQDVFTIQCERADHVRFVAERMEFVSRAAARKSVRNFPGFLVEDGALRRFSYQGQNAAEIGRASSEHGCGWMRFVLAGSDNIMLVVSTKQASCSHLNTDVTRFFDSLDIRKR